MAIWAIKLGGDRNTTASAVITYDPANEATFPDGSLDITACDLDDIEVTVGGVGSLTLHLWRSQGTSKTSWRDVTLTAGVTTYTAGGPVKTFEDIAAWQVVT